MKSRLRLLVLCLVCWGQAACERSPELPDPSSPEYAQTVASFYTGLAAAQVGEGRIAEEAFERVAELASAEPAGWANLGVLALQRRELEAASDRMKEARALAPDNSRIELISAILALESGHAERASEHLQRAVDLDPRNLQALYLLARAAEQQDDPTSIATARQRMGDVLAVQPDNLAALLEHARLAARGADTAAVRGAMDRIEALVSVREPTFEERLQAVRGATAAGDLRTAATELVFLQTELQRLPSYREDQSHLLISPARSELLLTRFLRLAAPSAQPAAADTGLAFEEEALLIRAWEWSWLRALWLSDEAPVALAAGNEEAVWIQTKPEDSETLAFPGGGSSGPLPRSAVASLDYDYDFRVDLALAGAGGLRVFRQEETGVFTDVTSTVVPAQASVGAYAGVWAADLDMEGDLDLVLASRSGPPTVLRNRGDGTFERFAPFAGVERLREFVWADLDSDGDPDAALLDSEGRLQIFSNLRHQDPPFAPHALPDDLRGILALTAADLNRDATVDLVVLKADGTLRLLSLAEDGAESEVLARWEGMPAQPTAATQLFVVDLDNNGDLDVVASTSGGSVIWLNTARGLRLHGTFEVRVTDVAPLTDSGRLDLIGLSASGDPLALINSGTKEYYAATLRPRAAEAAGDRRINPFGIGGEIEIRAGLLYQKHVIGGPAVHFGLGDNARIDVARIIWPNGSVQAEFDLPATKTALLTRQRLKGSCPWLFAFDGEEMRFVTDFIWRTALGLRINLQGKAAVVHSEDWVKIRGDQLAPRDGFYDLRLTAELWETFYFDHISLMAVDHPAGTEVFVDERFTIPAPEPALHAMSPLRPVAEARDQEGRDVTTLIGARDERYLDTFELGPYQGVAEDHHVELDLGDGAPTDGPLWLVAAGWVYPTDSSINLALDQGDHAPPRSLQLEVPDGRGGWEVARADLGFPAGKAKTILLDLQGLFRPGMPRRVRLRTNMEIYWDHIAWAVSEPDSLLRTHRLLPSTADLRYRGFSVVHQAGRTAPELPEYRLAGTAPRWRDLIGYYTRFGDVRPLNESVDDRYIIMNAGDELVLRFPALPPPPEGWIRDFVLIGDGWVKDGDLNTGFSETVLPLPYHGLNDYDRAPGRLEDDPGYLRHPSDWALYHTRYVTPQEFHHALVPARDD